MTLDELRAEAKGAEINFPGTTITAILLWCVEEIERLRSDDAMHLRLAADYLQQRKAFGYEIQRLHAVIDQLPHTADGVPVVPGLSVFRADPSGVGTEHLIANQNWASDTTSAPHAVYPYWKSCYSTIEAAEEARDE